MIDQNSRNSLLINLSGDFLRAIVAHSDNPLAEFNNTGTRRRAVQTSLSLAEDYISALDEHLEATNGEGGTSH